jgi:NADH-quinone oxidoreductase subunit I
MLGEAIIKGMAVTARNFFGSYVSAERLTTIQYPEQRQTLNESVRNFPFLVFDGDDAQKGLRCVACQICEKECPPKCIYIVKSKDKRIDYKGQPQFYPAVFDIDISVCMSCQICVEACPFESIKMDQEFELSATDRFAGLVLHKHQLARANVHYRKIHPRDAAESDAALAVEKAKAEAKAKADAEAKSAAARAALAGTAGSVVPPAPATAKAPAPVPPAAPKPAA